MAKIIYGSGVDLENAQKAYGSGYQYVDVSKGGNYTAGANDIIVGGSAVTGNVQNSGATHLWGNDRYGTADAINKHASSNTGNKWAQNVVQPGKTPVESFNNPGGGSSGGLNDFAQQASADFLAQQKAQLEATLAQQLADLENMLNQAIKDGEVSVREAQQQFAQQKAEIEKKAYADSQATALYSQNMGIQNSQQAVGLMQGDQARTAGLNNQNATSRDNRIADIRSRLDAIRNQKEIGANLARQQYNQGLLNAQAQASQMYNDKMFGVALDDYQANRDQQFAQQNMQFQNNLDLMKLQESSKLQVEQMMVGHKLDLEKMSQSLKDSIQLENLRYGNQSALQSQSSKLAMNELIKKAELEMKQEEYAYKVARERELSKYKPGTDEYRIREAQLADAFKQSIANIHAGTVYEYTAKSVLTDPKLPANSGETLTKPTSQNWFLDWATGFNKKDKSYNAQQEAINRYNQFMKDPTSLMK